MKPVMATRHDGEPSKKMEDAGVDKISSLPDWILHEILSSVDLKHLVQTSVFSRRWRYLWTSHPYLNLEYRSRVWKAEESDDPQFRKFTNFITRFLSLRNHSCKVLTSTISIYFFASPSFLNHCFSYLIEHGVEKLQIHSINCCSLTKYRFPPCFYTCESITELDLSHNHDVALHDAVLNLPNLKKLSLVSFTFRKVNNNNNNRDNCITSELFSKCVNLECLVLDLCDFRLLNVSLPVLKRLDVRLNSAIDPKSKIEIKLDTPLLSSFRLEGGASVLLNSVSELSCMEKVYINLHQDELSYCRDNVKEASAMNLIKMLEQLGNASDVTLAAETAEILAMKPVSVANCTPPFGNLKHLKFLEPCGSVRLPPEVLTYLTIGSPYRESVLMELSKEWWHNGTRDGGEIVVKRQHKMHLDRRDREG